MARGLTRNTKQRAVRQEALREQLSKQKHIEHVVDLVNKIKDENNEIGQEMLNRYKLVIDTKLKLINKYCADLKSVEMSGELEVKPHEDWLDIINGDDE
jgi:hypothetical protein